MTAMLLHSPAMTGLILATKSIARYPAFERRQFAEYPLIATLLSLPAAMVGRIIWLKTFHQAQFCLGEKLNDSPRWRLKT